MKCLNCGQENKDIAKLCKKCGRDLTLPPAWFPDWRWHVRTLAAIYAALIVLFFTAKWLLRKLPPPYDIRDIPAEMTPWLKNRAPSGTDSSKASAPSPDPYKQMGLPAAPPPAPAAPAKK